MKFLSTLKKMSVLEMFVIAIFIVYIIFPIATPMFMAPYVESPLGMIVIFCITVFLFIYSNPVLAVLYVFVAYELLRRSTKAIRPSPLSNYIQYTQPEIKKDNELNAMKQNLPLENITLEEVVVANMAPIGKSDPISFSMSTYKPVATNVQGASPI
jgi:hypothetical protein